MSKLLAQTVGRLGELAVEKKLLQHGWIVGNFNNNISNTVAYDLFAVKGKQRICIRVKSTSGSMIQYAAKKDGEIFKDLQSKDKGDFVVIVIIGEEGDEEFYVVPTKIVDKTLKKANEEWLKQPKKDGTARKKTSHRALDFNGEKTESAPHRGMRGRWAKYRDNWTFS